VFKILQLFFLIGAVISQNWGDAPTVVLRIRYIESINVLMLDSVIAWNLPEVEVNKVVEISSVPDEYIVHGNKVGLSREYRKGDKLYKIDVFFPERLLGRDLSESRRAEVKITCDDKVIFYSKYFGQYSSQFSFSKLRPSSVVIDNIDRLIVKGSFGEGINHIEGYTLEYSLEDESTITIDDEEIEKRVLKQNADVAN
jgi:hypothetical protein